MVRLGMIRECCPPTRVEVQARVRLFFFKMDALVVGLAPKKCASKIKIKNEATGLSK